MELPSEGLHLDADGLVPVILGESYEQLNDKVVTALTKAFKAADQYLAGFEPFRRMVLVNRQLSQEVLMNEVAAGKRGLEDFKADLRKYQQQLEDVRSIPAVK